MSVIIKSNTDINQLYEDFYNIDKGDISKTDKDNLRRCLQGFPSDKLNNVKECKRFIELVKLFREVVLEDLQNVGTNFVDMIKGMLTVGNDGIYSSKLRFLYELIQNVDDCDYSTIDDCDLNIKFKWNTNPGEIVLKYNEIGFSPSNVFDITGIAEKSKNIDANKNEIGEKGIGFKSVFGVADRVHIKSGYFSFILNKDEFTIPYPKYDDYEYTSGTEMILYMSSSKVREIYDELIKQYYSDKNSIINNNPIMFLNKLTHLWMGFDDNRFIDFKVTRKKELGTKFELEKNVIFSMDYHDYNSRDIEREEHRVINCFRYSMPIEYDREACVSRYGKDTKFFNRKMAIIAVVPIDVKNVNSGRVYSFLPTGIKMNVPIAVHAPFKLDVSREYVDPQHENKWFRDTVDALKKFYISIYLNLAKIMKNRIVEYLPEVNEYWWMNDNQKVDCLCLDVFTGKTLSALDIFIDDRGVFQKANKVVSFTAEDYELNQSGIFNYLSDHRKLFIPSKSVNMERFGVQTLKNLRDKLFSQLWEESDYKSEIYHVLLDNNYDLKKKFMSLNCSFHFDMNHISAIEKDRDIFSIYRSVFGSKDFLDKNHFILKRNDFEKLDNINYNIIFDLMDDVVLSPKIKGYITKNKDNIYAMPGDNDRFFFMAANAIIVSKTAPLKAFGFLIQEYDDKNTFSATLKLRQASIELDNVSASVSNESYLDSLINVRTSIMNAFGKNVYGKYIQLINESGADNSRFIQELLQNADDCKYSDSESEPYFYLRSNGNELTINYNEDGFTKSNVRAITAIGESTKKLLYSDSIHVIGEKGVGFKAVFCVAEKVQIF